MKLKQRLKLMLKVKLWIFLSVVIIGTIATILYWLLRLTAPAVNYIFGLLGKLCSYLAKYIWVQTCSNSQYYWETTCDLTVVHSWPLAVMYIVLFMITNVVFFTLFYDEKEHKKKEEYILVSEIFLALITLPVLGFTCLIVSSFV